MCERATNARRPFYLMKLKMKVRTHQKKKYKNKSIKNKMMSENHFFVANSRFKSIFHQWRALYRTQSFACFRFFFCYRTSRVWNEEASHQRKQSYIGNRNTFGSFHFICALFFAIFHHHCHLLITNKKHVSTIYFGWNSLLEFVMMEFVVLSPPVTAYIDYLFFFFLNKRSKRIHLVIDGMSVLLCRIRKKLVCVHIFP